GDAGPHGRAEVDAAGPPPPQGLTPERAARRPRPRLGVRATAPAPALLGVAVPYGPGRLPVTRPAFRQRPLGTGLVRQLADRPWGFGLARRRGAAGRRHLYLVALRQIPGRTQPGAPARPRPRLASRYAKPARQAGNVSPGGGSAAGRLVAP